jgi:Tfp pilus assembly protein PilN
LQALKGDIVGMEARLDDPRLMAMVEEVDKSQKELDGLKADALTLGAMQAFLAHESIFDYDKLKTISDRLVEDTYLESIHYSGRQLSLRGITEKDALTRIAQFLYRLRMSGEFDGFNINLISRPLLGNESLYGYEIGFIPLADMEENGS